MKLEERLQTFRMELTKRFAGEWRDDPYTKIFYSTDASIYQVMPLAVVLPRHVEDVHAVVELAAAYQIPVLPRTSGSSLAGQAVNEAVVIDMTRYLDQILEINVEERWVRVQPGVVLDRLNHALAPIGLQYGPDPASSNRAAMGGIVANNSTGSHSIVYGMTADHVQAMQVILSDGSTCRFAAVTPERLQQLQKQDDLAGVIYRRIAQIAREHQETILQGTPRHWRRCGGYNLDRFVSGATYRNPQPQGFNLAKLICGSEGTLAVMTDIQLNLVPKPKFTGLGVVHFDSLYEALAATPIILEIEPSAVELMDNLGLALCRKVPEYARLLQTFLEGQPNCILITEFTGTSAAEVRARVDRLGGHLQKRGVRASVVPALRPELQANVWAVRKVGLGLMMSVRGDHKPIPFIEDAAVPVEHLAEYVTRIEKFCNDLGTQVAYYAHASAGCVHIRPLINTKDAQDISKLPQISRFSVELLGQFSGALSSEHGDGRCRSWLNEAFYGRELYSLFKKVKALFDPQNIFNPGIIVNGQEMTANLRYGKDYHARVPAVHLDFSEEQGFDRAVEMCNGAGICRKQKDGAMCPSFMATREEENSTRGRANALRAAMSGLLPDDAMHSRRMFDVMDLCIECKACKAECPSSVDMAKIKIEFLANYYEKNSVPRRSRILGELHRYVKYAAGPQAGVLNWVAGRDVTRGALQRLLGLSHKRALPAIARHDFLRWYRSRKSAAGHSPDAGTVVLFHDTFTTYFEPAVPQAAVAVLEKLGYQVLLSSHGCCGRTMLSKGLVKEARQAARKTVSVLAKHAAAGIPIIGLEPSCLLTLRDEYNYLLPDHPAVVRVAAQSFLLEEFLEQYPPQAEKTIPLQLPGRRLLLHGHCHQKALVGTAPVRRMLEKINGCTVSEIDAGCCGLAGAFGYEAEHYDISMAIGEERLFPAIREAAAETLLVAPGFSCRSQIAHATGRKAYHPAQIFQMAIQE